MDIRPAKPEDGRELREVALRSLEVSYTLSPQTIKGAVKQWYDSDILKEKRDDENYILLVADQDGEIIGFAEGDIVEEGGDGDLLWLHVDPDYRGENVGNSLFHAIHDRLLEMGASRLRGRVLRDNPAGNDFYEQHGLVRASDEQVEIDGSEYVENIYVESEPAEVETVAAANGHDIYIDPDDSERGSVSPFLVAYTDSERTERYGYYCSNCNSLDIAMDSMGRAECNDCGNQRKATRWDAAYL
jgi:ribosomal protein S18 acetylase RimI-like enzyme